MPRQKGDPPFDEKEKLHRRLIAAWAREDDTVDPAAIEFEKCSVDRGMFSTPEEALARGKPLHVAVGSAEFGALPSEFHPDPPTGNPPPKPYELVVAYEPEDGNQAHTHLESHQLGEPNAKKPGPVMKQQMRNEIASKMRVTRRRDPVKGG